MEKNIWVINSNKKELIQAQQHINRDGAMQAICILSAEALQKAIERQEKGEAALRPSLIMLNYQMEKKEQFRTLSILQGHSAYAGVPLIFMVEKRERIIDEECYEKGATVVVEKPFSETVVLRITRMAWQYEQSRNYEKILLKQATELSYSRQIKSLNEQLTTRNELLRQIFGRYFSNDVVEKILENPSGASIGGEKKILTVMMADLRGFTAISEKLDADTVTDMINNFLEKMTEIIFKYHGSIIEFIGDGILAVFGAPLEHRMSENEAIAAAICMQNAMDEVNEYNIKKGYPKIEMGIGINKGEAFIGNIGSDKLMRYNIIGNTVNLTSRIENHSVGGQILVSSDTIADIRENVGVNSEFSISVKGFSEKIRVCELNSIRGIYEQKLNRIIQDELLEVHGHIAVKIRSLNEKEINDKEYDGDILAVSAKRVKIKLVEKTELQPYSNVEIYTAKEEKSKLFTDSYGKIVDVKDDCVTVHFTYKEG